MGSDFERWKKRRDAERARRERERQEAARERPVPYEEREIGYTIGSAEERARYEGPRRYRGYIPPAQARSRKAPRRIGDSIRGCLGCAGMLVGTFVLLLAGLTILGTFYWRQIEQRGQVNLLILGVDERSTETPPFRSDTLILAGFNPQEQEVALVNIPRDLWVTIPEYGKNRVNTAHFFGGPPLAKQTVRQNFGIPIHYYLTVNFDGFVSVIDALGGITIDVPERLYDTDYPSEDYGVKTIEIPAGVQEMDGETALIYARSRYSTDDFDRGRRQQEIIAAIQRRMLEPDTWLRLPAVLPATFAAFETDIPTQEWPALALILLRSKLERAAIGENDTQYHVTSGGAHVLIPVWDRINPVLGRYFE